MQSNHKYIAWQTESACTYHAGPWLFSNEGIPEDLGQSAHPERNVITVPSQWTNALLWDTRVDTQACCVTFHIFLGTGHGYWVFGQGSKISIWKSHVFVSRKNVCFFYFISSLAEVPERKRPLLTLQPTDNRLSCWPLQKPQSTLRASRLRLISAVSTKVLRSLLLTSVPRSLPAKSTNENLPCSVVARSLRRKTIWRTAWERDELALAEVWPDVLGTQNKEYIYKYSILLHIFWAKEWHKCQKNK